MKMVDTMGVAVYEEPVEVDNDEMGLLDKEEELTGLCVVAAGNEEDDDDGAGNVDPSDNGAEDRPCHRILNA